MYDLNIWWHFFQFFIFMCPASFLIFRVFENELRVKKTIYWLMAIIYCIVISGIIATTITEISPHKEFSLMGIGSIIVFSMVMIKILIKKNTFSLLFVFFVFLNVQYSTIFMAKATLDNLTVLRIFTYEHANTLVLSLVYYILFLPILYFILVKLYKRIVDEKIISKHMELFFCLPAGFYFAISIMMQVCCESNVGVIKETLLPLIIINICAFFSYFAALESIIASHDAALEHEKLFTAKTQLSLWQEQHDNLQIQIASEAKVRHDWRHHIIAVLSFVDHADLEGLRNYLGDYKEKYLQPDEPPICDIVSLNMMFQFYKRKAAELKIDLSISSVIIGKCHVSVSDLTVIFGNLLENAMEACERQNEGEKSIHLKVKNRDDNLIAIICENSFDGVVNRVDDKIQSRKEKGGLGLSSIRSVAKKYNGALEIKEEGKVFKVYVALIV
ncbi:MAG: ATP-binding protein [Eubacterium sp.]